MFSQARKKILVYVTRLSQTSFQNKASKTCDESQKPDMKNINKRQ